MINVWAQKQKGFTLVELLIVIVVIAILAAISVVAYNGIQNRAEVSKTANAISAYKKGLMMYKADKGVYPIVGAMCLGDQYDAFTGQDMSSCRTSVSRIAVTGNAAGRDALKEFMGENLPMPSKKFITYSSGLEAVGGHFYGSGYNYTLDGSPVVAIEYYVNSNTCPVGPIYSTSGSPNFSTPAVETRTSLVGDGSRCFILLPDN